MTPRCLLATVALLPLIAGQAGAVQRITRQQTFNRQVAPGGAIRVFNYASWGTACEARTPPNVVVRVPPQHGRVTTTPAQSTVSVVSEGAVDCSGHTYPAIAVVYTADPGYSGRDTFEYDVVYDRTSPRHDTVVIDVR